TVKVWDTVSGKAVFTLEGHAWQVFGVVFHPDGKSLVSSAAGSDRRGELRGWDAMTGKERFVLKGIGSGVYGLAFSPDGKRLAAACGDKTVKVWDVKKLLEK